MSNCSNFLNIIHFADDSTIFFSGSNLSLMINTMNDELKGIDDWLCTNKLSLNASKSKYMIISNKNIPENITITIRDTNIQRVSVMNFLGVSIDHKLTFKPHISEINSKISRAGGMIRRISPFLPYNCLRMLYFSLVQSRLSYAITAWGGASRTHLDKIMRVQSRIISVLESKCGSHYFFNPVLNIYNLYAYFCVVKLYNYLNLGLHEYFTDAVDILQPSHSYSTRHRINVMI